MDLDQLVNQFQNKNLKAFETLYDMYNVSLTGVVFNIVRDRSIAEEVTQDVFVKIWHNAESYAPSKGRFFTWILNIARNAAIDKTRSRSYKHAPVSMDTATFADTLHSGENLDRATDAIGLREIVAKLAKKCVQIIEAIYFRGYTQKEVSEEMDIPLGTVKTRNRNCIGELREMLDE